MTEVDTSTEAVDTLARQFNHTSPTRKCLMALAAERDALKAEVESRASAHLKELSGAMAEIERLRDALTPFAEPHSMGDSYVKFSPALIKDARAALKGTDA